METAAMNDTNKLLEMLLNEMTGRMGRMETKLDDNTVTTGQTLAEAKRANSRVTALEKRMAAVEKSQGRKVNLPPNVMYLTAVGFVMLLAIIASILHVDLGGLVK